MSQLKNSTQSPGLRNHLLLGGGGHGGNDYLEKKVENRSWGTYLGGRRGRVDTEGT